MNIVIVGAGSVGQYIASMLSKQNHNVILIDKDPKRLEEASWLMDIAVRQGSGTDWQLLDELTELRPDIFLALTENDAVNLVACSIAKNLGYPLTISRLKDDSYLNNTRLDFARLFDIDYFICPEVLAAADIYKQLITPGSLALENFAHGAAQMRTMKVPSSWKNVDIPIKDLNLPSNIVIGLIRRIEENPNNFSENSGVQLIFPGGTDFIKRGDEVTCIGKTENIATVHKFFGIEPIELKSVAIIGGSLVGFNLAKMLGKQGYNVRLIDKDQATCVSLAEKLPNCTVINHDGTDLNFLLSEKIENADLVVICTNNDETNILVALLLKEAGCKNIAITLFNNSYASLLNKHGITQIISPRISAANHILSLAFSGRITSLVSLYENAVEILEITVSANSKITGIPLVNLSPLLPKELLIIMIQNRGQIMIANGNRIISPGDNVIVLSNPKHLNEITKIF